MKPRISSQSNQQQLANRQSTTSQFKKTKFVFANPFFKWHQFFSSCKNSSGKTSLLAKNLKTSCKNNLTATWEDQGKRKTVTSTSSNLPTMINTRQTSCVCSSIVWENSARGVCTSKKIPFIYFIFFSLIYSFSQRTENDHRHAFWTRRWISRAKIPCRHQPHFNFHPFDLLLRKIR